MSDEVEHIIQGLQSVGAVHNHYRELMNTASFALAGQQQRIKELERHVLELEADLEAPCPNCKY